MAAAPDLGPAQTAVAIVRQTNPSHTKRQTDYHLDTKNHLIETPAVRLSLSPEFGGTLEALGFPQITSEPMIRRAENDWQRAAVEPDNLTTGQLAIVDASGRTITDHQIAEIEYPQTNEDLQVFVPVRCVVHTDIVCRAIPWSRLLLSTPEAPMDLNTGGAEQAKAALAGLLVAVLAASAIGLVPVWVAAPLFVPLWAVNR